MLYNRLNKATVGIKIAFEKPEQAHVKSQPTVHQKQFFFAALEGSLLVGMMKETSKVSNVQREPSPEPPPWNLHFVRDRQLENPLGTFGTSDWSVHLEPSLRKFQESPAQTQTFPWNLHLERVEPPFIGRTFNPGDSEPGPTWQCLATTMHLQVEGRGRKFTDFSAMEVELVVKGPSPADPKLRKVKESLGPLDIFQNIEWKKKT